MINCKVELKLKWTKHCILPGAGAGNVNDNDDDNDIIFTIKETKLCLLVVNLSSGDNQKLIKTS